MSTGEPPDAQSPGGGWPVLHYGRVPRFDPSRWDFTVTGATVDGRDTCWDHDTFAALPRADVVTGLHCVTGFSVPESTWTGVTMSSVMALAPPAPGATHALVWATFGYSATVDLADLAAGIVASHRDGVPLTPEHGWPYRLVIGHLYGWKGPKWVRSVEYTVGPRRGFWEERGYHLRGRVDARERYAHEEVDPVTGP